MTMYDLGRPRACWRDCVSRLGWECLGVPPDELEQVTRAREDWASLLRLLPLRPNSGSRGQKEVIWLFWMFYYILCDNRVNIFCLILPLDSIGLKLIPVLVDALQIKLIIFMAV